MFVVAVSFLFVVYNNVVFAVYCVLFVLALCCLLLTPCCLFTQDCLDRCAWICIGSTLVIPIVQTGLRSFGASWGLLGPLGASWSSWSLLGPFGAVSCVVAFMLACVPELLHLSAW